MRRLGVLAAVTLLGVILGPSLAAAQPPGLNFPLQPAPRLVYPLLQFDANTETLIAVSNTSGDDSVPIHMNFFDAACTVVNREDELTPLDVDVYVYSGLGVHAKGAGEIHTAFSTHGTGHAVLIGEAVIISFTADTMVGYSAAAVNGSLDYNVGAGADNVLGLPHFLAEVSGVLANEIALAAVPCTFPNVCDGPAPASADVYPSGSGDVFTVQWRMYDGNEEEASARSTWKCVLHAPLSSIFLSITTLGLLPPDAEDKPRILFYPYGWVRASIEYAPTGASDTWGAVGMFRQQYVDGTFSLGEATNLWENLPCVADIDGTCPTPEKLPDPEPLPE